MYARKNNRPRNRQAPDIKIPAPVAGWVSNRNISMPSGDNGQFAQGALILDNFIPRATSVYLRRGKLLYATLGVQSQVAVSLFSYNVGANKKLFSSTDTDIYDITNVEFPNNALIVDDDGNYISDGNGNRFGWSSTVGLQSVGGYSGGDWSVVQFGTTGGTYLIGVNGTNVGFIYDGTEFYPYTDGGSWRMAYDNLVQPFTDGELIVGSLSGAQAVVWKNTYDPLTGEGMMILTNVSGTFQDDEDILGSIDGEASVMGVAELAAPGITFGDGNVGTQNMSFVWVYRNRLYFAENGSMNAWYLPVDSIGGSATVLPLNGIFDRGGYLLFGQDWSLSSGGDGGLSEQCVFMSSEGQAAIFQGLGPDDVATWRKQGLYRVGKPLGKNAFFRGAGDLAIATTVGLVPLSRAIELDFTALTQASISWPITDAWQAAVAERGDAGWIVKVWPEMKLAFISPPLAGLTPVIFVTNTETGTWTRFTGWDARSMEVFNGKLYFGSSDGGVFEANRTGSDDGEIYTGKILPLYDDLNAPGSLKIPKLGRYTVRASARIRGRTSFMHDYREELPPAPASENLPPNLSLWGQGIWGTSKWVAGGERLLNNDWVSLGGGGYAITLGYQVSSQAIQPLDVEIVEATLIYEQADIVS